MLLRPEPTKERVEWTTLGTTATEIPHSTRFTLPLLLGIQRYMWRNHFATTMNWWRQQFVSPIAIHMENIF